MLSLVADVRLAIRLLAKRPGLTVTTALTLGLGIGLTTTMFSVVRIAVWRGLPVERSGRVVHIERTFARQVAADPAARIHDFLDWQAQQRTFTGLAAFRVTSVSLGGQVGAPERLSAALVTANLLTLLGADPVVGRLLRDEDDRPGAPPVAIVSDAVWRDHFDRQPNLEGLTLRLDGVTVPIVGVMPASFRFPLHEDIWLPLRVDATSVLRGQGPGLEVIGRMRDGISLAAAQADLTAIAGRLARDYPATNAEVGAIVQPYVVRFLGDSLVTLFYAMFAASVGVLIIACVNTVSLVLAAASVRTREMAVRAALGASRMRIVAQVLVEVCGLTAVGAVVGVAMASIGIRMFNNALVAWDPPFWLDIRLDTAAVAFVVALVAVVTLLAGLYPAVKVSGPGAAEILKSDARSDAGWRGGRLRRTLVVVEVALAAALLVSAGVLVRTVWNVRNLDFGISADGVLVGAVMLPMSSYPDEPRQRQFWDELLTRLDQQPAVSSSTFCTSLPGLGTGRIAVGIDGVAYGSAAEYPRVRYVKIANRFFETFDVTLAEGRNFGTLDSSATQRVVIVNRRFATRFLIGSTALGRRLRLPGSGGEVVATIVGVAPDLRMGVNDRDPEVVYLPLTQWPERALSLAVRTQRDPLAAAASVRAAVATLDPDLPVSDVRTMRDALASIGWFYGTFSWIFVIFGVAALLLTLVGLYGLMAHAVSQRTREIGVRLALGARPIDVLRIVFTQAFLQIVGGLAGGLTIAANFAPLLRAFLVGVNPRDGSIYILVAGALALTGLLAVARPAVRAARTDPTEALRFE